MGAAIGALTGGRLARLAMVPMPAPWLVLGAIAAQPLTRAFTGRADNAASRAALGVGLTLVGGWLALAIRARPPVGVLVGLLLLTAGWAMNGLVIGLNGRMPVAAGVVADGEGAGPPGA